MIILGRKDLGSIDHSDVWFQEYEYFYLVCIMIHVISITINAGLPDLGFRDLHGAAGAELASLIIYTYAECLMLMSKSETPILALVPCRDTRYICQFLVSNVYSYIIRGEFSTIACLICECTQALLTAIHN